MYPTWTMKNTCAFDAIFVVVKFFHRAHFEPFRESNDAELFFKEIVQNHRLSTTITLNKDTRFFRSFC
jgi:hypothetical protein